MVRNVEDVIKFEFERCQTLNVFSRFETFHIFVTFQRFLI